MKRYAVATLALATAALVGTSACAGTPDPGSEEAGATIAVEVRNDFPGASPREISIVTSGTMPRRLGTVTAGQTEVLTVRGMELAEQHRLIAEPLSGGGAIRSPIISLEPGAHVVWELDTNKVYLQ